MKQIILQATIRTALLDFRSNRSMETTNCFLLENMKSKLDKLDSWNHIIRSEESLCHYGSFCSSCQVFKGQLLP